MSYATVRGPCGLVLFLGLTLGACVAPGPEPLNEVEMVDATRSRRDAVTAHLESTLREAGLNRAQPAMPSLAPAFRDAALAHGPEIRRRRREVEELRGRAASAGQPGPIGGRVRGSENPMGDFEIESAVTLDLFGLLGVGPAEAARLLAETQVRAAAARLEAEVWRTSHAADRAWVEYVTACCHADVADAIAALAAQDATRIEALVEAGAVGSGPAGRALAFFAIAEQRVEMMNAAIAARRADLSRTIGLSVTDPLLAEIDVDGMAKAAARLPQGETRPDPEALFRRHPQLRALRLEYAVAEADLRAAVAAQWPSLNLGPRLVFRPDGVLPGGLLQFRVPFPGSQDGFIAAAVARRTRARERLEDAWLAAEATLHAARERVDRARNVLEDEAVRIDSRSAAAFRAARTKLAVDPSFVRNWADALADRGQGALARANARRELLLAVIDLREAGGHPSAENPTPSPTAEMTP